MKFAIGIALKFVAFLLYILGFFVLAQTVGYSEEILWATLTDGVLLSSFIATAFGAFTPAVILHYFGNRLMNYHGPGKANAQELHPGSVNSKESDRESAKD